MCPDAVTPAVIKSPLDDIPLPNDKVPEAVMLPIKSILPELLSDILSVESIIST